jgi:purine-binding chemotaxis protein CheW
MHWRMTRFALFRPTLNRMPGNLGKLVRFASFTVPKDNIRPAWRKLLSGIKSNRGNPMSAAAKHMEVLTFALGEEEYGIDIQLVQELRGYEAVTKVANAPAHFKGVINLRGVIVPVIDMRIKFNLGEPSYDHLTVVIILNMSGRVVGMVVDAVSDVTDLAAEQVKPPPSVSGALDIGYLLGIGTIDERMLLLVDIEKLMSSDDIGAIARLAA